MHVKIASQIVLYRKPVWILMRQEMVGFRDGSGISCTICKQSAPCSRQITMPTRHHWIFTGWTLFPVAPPGFCNRGGSEVWVYRGSRVQSPPVPVVLSVYQRGSLVDGLAMYLSCDTKKFHDNESTHILHNFWTSTHRGKLLPLPPWRRHWFFLTPNQQCQSRYRHTP